MKGNRKNGEDSVISNSFNVKNDESGTHIGFSTKEDSMCCCFNCSCTIEREILKVI